METYNLKLQHVNSDLELQNESLDSFSNVIHYDSALIDTTTGKKPNTEQVSDSSQFAWLSNQIPAPQSQQRFLLTPFQEEPQSQLPPTPPVIYDVNAKTTTKSDLANQIDRMIRDVYSEIEIPFNPLQDRKSVPDWYFLENPLGKDFGFNKQPQHIVAQPSRVKVTHVYNQCVLTTQVPSSPVQVTQLVTPSNNRYPTAVSAIPVVTECDIKTLLQVSANTTSSRKYLGQQSRPIPRMAEYSPTRDGGKESEPFESVADALHLQQSVIGGRNLVPVSADVVARVVAEAERKIKLGQTPTPVAGLGGNNTPVASFPDISTSGGYESTTTTEPSFDLPPIPKLPDPIATRELIRIQAPNIVRSSERTSWFGSNSPAKVHETRNPSVSNPAVMPAPFSSSQSYGINTSADIADMDDNVVTVSQLDNVIDDNQSIASTSSEVENINDNATEAFLKSLPPFKYINLSSIMPEPHPKLDYRHSPPVKETSFRPLNQGEKPPTVRVESVQGYQSYVTDTSGFLPEADRVHTPQSNTPIKTKSKFVIPKPGPLFQSTPRPKAHLKSSQASHDPRMVEKGSESNAYVEEILREKAKLEGQLEMLSVEAQSTLQKRAELQAQVASLKLKLISQKTQKHDAEKDILKADLESLKQLRISLEESLGGLQRELEEKSEEGRGLQDELNQSQDVCDKLNLKLKEIKDELKSREMTIQALKNKIAELYVEVQTSMQTKMEADNEARSAKSDLISLQNTKDWYQQQLELATKARSELQREMTMLQAQAASQTSIIERLKNENNRLRQQFSEIQNRALKEKEMLAKHLEAIESDMMDREAAFQEIQRERSFLEDTFNNKIQTAEDEKNRISLLMQMTKDLENQLDKAHADLKKKQNQIVSLENENIELMKKLSLSQETAMEKDSIIEDLKRNMIDLDERLKAFQNSVIDKDTELLQLKEEKAKTEIALKSALLEKASVDEVLDILKADMGKVETSFKVMRHELSSKSTEVSAMKTHTSSSDELVEKLKDELENERRVCESAKHELEIKTEQFNDLQGQKIKLDSEILIFSEKLSSMETAHEEAMKEKQFLDSELNATRDKLDEVKQQMQVQIEEEKSQKSTEGGADYKIVQEECVQLKEKISDLEKSSKKEQLKSKARAAKLAQDLKAVKDELLERQKMFDENIEVVSGKLREVVGEREKLETELIMVHRKYELSMLEQKDQIGTELQNLASELQQSRLEKQELETNLVELQHVRDTELGQYRQQLSALDAELQEALEAGQRDGGVSAEANQALQLELEKEKGRLEGLMQSNVTLKQHVSQLETALAGRESVLLELQAQLTQVVHEREQESHENIRRVHVLEETLQKEKDGQRDTRKQIGQKITENKKLRRHNDNLKQEVEQARLELEHATQESGTLRSELETGRQNLLSQQAEMMALEGENKGLQRELSRVQQHLADNMAREPVIQEQIKSLEWQLQLKSSELEAAQQQVLLEEERQRAEIQNIKQLLQEKNSEIEVLKVDVSAMKHDRQLQVARVTELRSALKTSIQHHKVTQKMSKLKTLNGGGDAGHFELPPLPFDLDDMDKLLQDTTVRALESKPLDNLQNCLLNLRSEISGLQHQMEVHTNTIETSTNTWTTLEQQVEELRHVVQTISNTTMSTSTTNSLAAAAVDIANKSSQIMDI